jgi:CHAT domain-containing protein
LSDLLGRSLRAPIGVLSGCETLLGRRSALAGGLAGGADALSLGQTLQLGGVDLVVASTMRVNDVAAALLMKRFHRALKKHGPVEALRQAQLVVRKYQPHPSWWATFTVLVR